VTQELNVDGTKSIEIYDITGKKVSEQYVNRGKIHLSLSNGIYFIKPKGSFRLEKIVKVK